MSKAPLNDDHLSKEIEAKMLVRDAAPDMLEALRGLVAAYAPIGRTNEWWVAARAAIAKAEGKS